MNTIKKQSERQPAKRGVKITLNGTEERFPRGITILALLHIVHEKDRHVMVELNNRYVAPNNYAKTMLSAGDKVELINPDFGG